MDNGIKLTLEPESRSTFLKVILLIVHGIATARGSFLFIGIFLADETKPHFLVAIFCYPSTDLFFAITSFINFLYKGMCSSASKKGRFTSNFLNKAVNFSKSFSFEFFFVTLEGKGSLITGSTAFLFFSSTGLNGGITTFGSFGFSLISKSTSITIGSSISSFSFSDSKTFLLLVVTTLIFSWSFGFFTVELGRLPCACRVR